MTDTVVIVGGGFAGVEAALECARAGARPVILERSPIIGGKLAARMAEGAGEGGQPDSLPTLKQLSDEPAIRILTQAELESVSGRPGNFSVKYKRKERFVSDACTRCNLCRAACPVVVSNEWDAGLTYRKAIHTPLATTLPEAYVIDLESCLNQPPNYLPCRRCAEVCDDNAISFENPLQVSEEIQAASLVVAAGLEISESPGLEELGYGGHPDILTSAELQRMLETPGPSGGFAVRPSNEEYPESVLLVLNRMDSFAMYVLASQMHQLMEQGAGEISVLVPSLPAAGAQLGDVAGVELHQGGMFRAAPGDEGRVRASWEDSSEHRLLSRNFDLVVLDSQVAPPSGLPDLAAALQLMLDEDGYVAGSDESTGIYPAGCVTGPKSVAETRRDALDAAERALADVNPRLLDPGYLAKKGIDPDAETTSAPPPEDDVRDRIEQMLYGLLNQR